MNELWQRMTKYMAIEENMSKKVKKRITPIGTKSRRNNEAERGLSRYSQYTPFNASRNTILREAYNLELIQLLEPRPSLPRADLMKRCTFHQSSSHTSEECHCLQDLIESLVCSGALARFA